MSARRAWTAALGALALGALAALAGCRQGHRTSYVPRDASLRGLPLYWYPAGDPAHPPRAIVFFFGNDVGFWQPHQDLAWRLAADGYAVVGLDVRRYLARLPMPVARRDSAFDSDIGPLIARARAELRADTLPLVLAGHSFGAEVAFHVALATPPPRLAGILAMSPRGSGHLVVTPQDLLNREPSGEGSWSNADVIRRLPPSVRIAIVRGRSDRFAKHDSAFLAAGGPRAQRWLVPFAGHSLKKLTIAGPMIEQAMAYLVAGRE